MRLTVWSIGHSNHPIERFMALLDGHKIQLVIDVRSKPMSRWNPQFNRKALQEMLRNRGIEYLHAPALGGLHEGAGEGAQFEMGLDLLESYAERKRLAVMCSEGDPKVCHRSSMIAAGWRSRANNMIHILPDGSLVSDEPGDPSGTEQLRLF